MCESELQLGRQNPKFEVSWTTQPFVPRESTHFFFFFFFFFLGLHPRRMEAPSPGLKLELQMPAYATATATWDLSLFCNLHHSSLQCNARPGIKLASSWILVGLQPTEQQQELHILRYIDMFIEKLPSRTLHY